MSERPAKITDRDHDSPAPARGLSDRPLRVALNAWFLRSPHTGTGQYLHQLVSAIQPLTKECGVDLELVSPKLDETSQARVRVARPYLPGYFGKVEFEHLTFPRRAAHEGFDVVHIPHFGPPLSCPLPVIVTIHDLIPIVLPAYKGSWAVRLYESTAAAAARRADLVITDSRASCRDIIKHLKIEEERVRVIYLAAAPIYRSEKRPEELARVRAKYNLPDRFVLYLGGFDARKNIGRLVDAFSALEGERTAGWRLVLAGEKPERQSPLFPDVGGDAKNGVQLIGQVAEEDKPGLYSAASAFAYPSLYEGFGLPPLEAMASGTPVVCSDASSLPEVAGEGAMLLPPEDVSAWTMGLRALLSNETLRRELAQRGLEQARKFSWEQTARETMEGYHQASTKHLTTRR